jgi:hypothetical protein
MTRSRRESRIAYVIVSSLTLLGLTGARAAAHPGSGIVVDAKGQVYFTDTGQGVWKIDAKGRLILIHTQPYHWMALDEKGHLANSKWLGNFDRGSFERVTPAGAIPTLIISSDYPSLWAKTGRSTTSHTIPRVRAHLSAERQMARGRSSRACQPTQAPNP